MIRLTSGWLSGRQLDSGDGGAETPPHRSVAGKAIGRAEVVLPGPTPSPRVEPSDGSQHRIVGPLALPSARIEPAKRGSVIHGIVVQTPRPARVLRSRFDVLAAV